MVTATLASMTSCFALMLAVLPSPPAAAAAAAVAPPHAIAYRAGVTGRVGDLGPRLPTSVRNSALNPCNQTTVINADGTQEELYDVCDGPYSFIRCRGHDPLLIADCIPEPKYRCWVDEKEHEASCGRPAGQCDAVESSAESQDEEDYEVK